MWIIQYERRFDREGLEPLDAMRPTKERLERHDDDADAPEQTAPWWFDQQLW
jgi:hypothetical protein